MPIYEYQCSVCHHQLEAFQKISEPTLTECPHCHGATLNKLISSTSFQLKGTGWYVTDFRDKGNEKKKETTQGESVSASSGAEKGAKEATKETTATKGESSKSSEDTTQKTTSTETKAD